MLFTRSTGAVARAVVIVGVFFAGVAVPLLLSSTWQSPMDSAGTRVEAGSRRTPAVVVAERASRAVVAIQTERRGSGWSRGSRVQGEGSGVLINERGFLLTNYHVVRGADEVRILLQGERSYPATLVATSEESDLALLRVEARGQKFPFVSFGASGSLLPGETVVALGNPYGFQHTVSTGVVSAVKRTLRPPGSEEYNDFIQTDAAINPGNSGGALLNLHGEVVGIATAIFNQGWGISFAIPVDRIKEILEAYVYKEHYIGIETRAARDGLTIASVDPGSPAATAGLRPGDVLTGCDGHALKSRSDWVVASLGAGSAEPLRLTGSRRGRPLEAKVAAISLLWDRIGIRGSSRTVRFADRSRRIGLLVEQVRDPGPGRAVGLRRGDVLYQIAVEGEEASRTTISDESDLARWLQQHAGRPWRISVWRDGRVHEGVISPKR